MSNVYQNSKEVCNLGGTPIYMNDVVDACLTGRLNLFLRGDSGSGKTQLARDAMGYFGAKTLFVLGRNDMDTRELFQQINLGKLHQTPKYNLEPLINPETEEVEYFYPHVNDKGIFVYQKLSPEQTAVVRNGLEKIAGSTDNIKELTKKINTNLIVVDELPNCVPAVRAQLFNLFDGYIEINGRAYPIGDGYSVGIATGNIGQQFTESSNELGRALKDRMHVTVDTDYFHPSSSDTLEILAKSTNPRVEFDTEKDEGRDMVKAYKELASQEVPFNKLIIANYFIHGLDHCSKGSKREMKGAWPTQLENHEQGSDVGLVLPVSVRGAKSIVRLSQALDHLVRFKGGETPEDLESMLQAYRLVSTFSGVLNEADVQNKYGGNHYRAIEAVIDATRQQFTDQEENIAAAWEMVKRGMKKKKVMDLFGTEENPSRWTFMRDTLDNLLKTRDK